MNLKYDFPSNVKDAILDAIKELSPNQIWGIGSRFNGYSTEKSDWDFIVFVDVVSKSNKKRSEIIDFIITNRQDIKVESRDNETCFTFSGFKFSDSGNGCGEYWGENRALRNGEGAFDGSVPRYVKLKAVLVYQNDSAQQSDTSETMT